MVARVKKLVSALTFAAYIAKEAAATNFRDYLGSEVRWFGGLAEELGLLGAPVRESDFEALARGFAPDGTRLRQNAGKGTDGRGSEQEAWAFVISAAKHLDVIRIACPKERPEIDRAVEEAHNEALSFLESCARSRMGKAGAIVVPAKVIGISARHDGSRAGEPNTHFHDEFLNLGLRPDGSTGALHVRPLYEAQKEAALVFHAGCAMRLAALGFAVREAPERACGYRILGTEELGDAWSSRRHDIEKTLREWGREGDKAAADLAALHKRPMKTELAGPDACRRWEEDARARGFDLASIRKASLERENGRRLEAATERTATASFIERWRERSSLSAQAETLRLRPGPHVTERAIERAAKRHALSADETRVLAELLRGPSALRVLEVETEPSQLYRFLRALHDAVKGSGGDTLAVTHYKKQREALLEHTKLPAFTAKRAAREWESLRWHPFRDAPGERAFQRIGTDKLSDVLAVAAGRMSLREYRGRSWQRDREPLDLSRVPHTVTVHGALPERQLSAVFREANRHGARVLILRSALDAERSPALKADARLCTWSILESPFHLDSTEKERSL